jgi:hypothetical protein
MGKRLRFLVTPAVAAVLALGGGLMAAAPASAASAAPAAATYSCGASNVFGCWRFNGDGINIHKVYGSSTIVGQGQYGQNFAINVIRCTPTGDVGGDYVWDFGTDTATGITGSASDYYIGIDDPFPGYVIWYEVTGLICPDGGTGTLTA